MELKLLNHDFVKARRYIAEKSIRPVPDCVGYYCSDSTSKVPVADFFWYRNEYDLKDSLLNGWHAAENRRRTGSYNEEARVLKKYLEEADDLGKLFPDLPHNIFNDSTFPWCGSISDLLLDESEFAANFRKKFRHHIIKTKSGYYDRPVDYEARQSVIRMEKNTDPGKTYNQISEVPLKSEIQELLLDFVREGCLTALLKEDEMSKLRIHPLFDKYNIKEEDLVSLSHLYSSGIGIKVPHYPDGLRSIEVETGFPNDGDGVLKLFDRIFTRYGVVSSSGLTRHFTFLNEVDYYAFMKDISSVMLMGYYAMTYSRITVKE